MKCEKFVERVLPVVAYGIGSIALSANVAKKLRGWETTKLRIMRGGRKTNDQELGDFLRKANQAARRKFDELKLPGVLSFVKGQQMPQQIPAAQTWRLGD